MKITYTRQEAKELGVKSYFTGKPCLRGHMSDRTTSTARCEECNRIFNREHKRRQAQAKGIAA